MILVLRGRIGKGEAPDHAIRLLRRAKEIDHIGCPWAEVLHAFGGVTVIQNPRNKVRVGTPPRQAIVPTSWSATSIMLRLAIFKRSRRDLFARDEDS